MASTALRFLGTGLCLNQPTKPTATPPGGNPAPTDDVVCLKGTEAGRQPGKRAGRLVHLCEHACRCCAQVCGGAPHTPGAGATGRRGRRGRLTVKGTLSHGHHRWFVAEARLGYHDAKVSELSFMQLLSSSSSVAMVTLNLTCFFVNASFISNFDTQD